MVSKLKWKHNKTQDHGVIMRAVLRGALSAASAYTEARDIWNKQGCKVRFSESKNKQRQNKQKEINS